MSNTTSTVSQWRVKRAERVMESLEASG
jgi:hypothetical protein